MKYFSMLIKPASSLCNMRCKYCFYEDVASNRNIKSMGIMSIDVTKTLIDKTLALFDSEATITFAFQGGEPTIAGIKYFYDFVDYVNLTKKEYHTINYAIQTNGTNINVEWANFFKINNFLVGVSLDGFKINHDLNRIDSNNCGTFDIIMKNIQVLKDYQVDFNILTVLTSYLSNYPNELFDFYLVNNFDYIQLIPCLPSFNNVNDSFALKPKDFYHFYNTFFERWYHEFTNNHYISVTLFDNLIPLFNGVLPQQCGYLGFCSNQFVVEADGSVYPCDFYVLDQYCLGNILSDDIKSMMKSNIAYNFINEKKQICNLCQNCNYYLICKGQCKRMSVCYYNNEYCGYQNFIESNKHKITNVLKILNKKI